MVKDGIQRFFEGSEFLFLIILDMWLILALSDRYDIGLISGWLERRLLIGGCLLLVCWERGIGTGHNNLDILGIRGSICDHILILVPVARLIVVRPILRALLVMFHRTIVQKTSFDVHSFSLDILIGLYVIHSHEVG